MAILTDSGRAAVAVAIKGQTIHLAWGTGNASWDTTPVPEPAGATALVAEIGRRKVTQTLYCLPSADGEIEVPNGRFTVSDVPTKYLYLRFTFDFNDAPAATIRETAIFLGTVAKAGVPANQNYLAPADVEDAGKMLSLEYTAKIERSPSVRQQFEFVIQF